MDSALLSRLRADLAAADFSPASVTALLGEPADGARQRGVFAPGRRALAERPTSARSTLISLFLLGEAVAQHEIDAALPELGAAGARELGLIEAEAPGGVRGDAAPGQYPAYADVQHYAAALSLNPVAVVDSAAEEPLVWWILSDLDDQLRRGPARPDHVMGVGGATRSLIAQAPGGRVDRSLDLGTGCGIVALHLAQRGGHVVATDISERALMLARANAELNGLGGAIEFRAGSLFEPVAGEQFDLILSNPPFVITPRTGDGPVYEYRDGGLVGDALAEAVVTAGPAHLLPGGTLLCLANWETPWGGNGLHRVSDWIAGAGIAELSAWVIERDRVDPMQYAETWARDGGARPGSVEFDALLAAWLDDFAVRRIVSIGLGAIRVRRGLPGSMSEPLVHVEQATGALASVGLGAQLEDAFTAGSVAARMSDAEVLATRWLVSDAVSDERIHTPGAEAPHAITLVTDRPIARRVTADPLLAAAVGASDGDLTMGQIADALAQLLEVDAAAASEAIVSGARELAWLGMLTPAPANSTEAQFPEA
ncbi:class I SAM-dependent methyltransferase [Leucobacter chromiireducens]|uniref:Methyltransferase domain-containing protein n=1 Tax=Leucobacter chromiireducens subsp. chromiireducens TaxID=660067 RepID=A0ABS1SR74_9MICO|nr:methyltransferase [Leucobacter chromiireducens]MBL3690663.1 methyltransferase domain-containing protein [Leucobacter chromiireducens subsp. chromiireducens]